MNRGVMAAEGKERGAIPGGVCSKCIGQESRGRA